VSGGWKAFLCRSKKGILPQACISPISSLVRF
jgi:hypothetical protein